MVNGALVFLGATAWNFGNRALRNAYLPLLVRSNPLVVEKMKELSHNEGDGEGEGEREGDGNGQAMGSSDNGDEETGQVGGRGEAYAAAGDGDAKLAVNKLSEQLGSEYSIKTSAYFFVGQMIGFAVQVSVLSLLLNLPLSLSFPFSLSAK